MPSALIHRLFGFKWWFNLLPKGHLLIDLSFLGCCACGCLLAHEKRFTEFRWWEFDEKWMQWYHEVQGGINSKFLLLVVFFGIKHLLKSSIFSIQHLQAPLVLQPTTLIMKTFSIISLAVLGYPIVAATSIPRSARKCVEYSIPLTVTAPNLVPAFPIFKDSFDVVDLVNQAARRDVDEAFHPFPLSDPPIVTANVTIAATFCTPKYPNGYEKTVLLASHGLGFDRR